MMKMNNFDDDEVRKKMAVESSTLMWEKKIKENAIKAKEMAEKASVVSAKRINKKYMNSRNKIILSKISRN